MDLVRSAKLKAAQIALLNNVAQDWLLRNRVVDEARTWSWQERNEGFRRARRTYALALQLLRSREYPDYREVFEKALVSSCTAIVDECLFRGDVFVAYAHSMELLELVEKLIAVNDEQRRNKGETPYESLIAGHAGLLAFLAASSAFLIAEKEIEPSREEVATLVNVARRLRAYRNNDIEFLLAAGYR